MYHFPSYPKQLQEEIVSEDRAPQEPLADASESATASHSTQRFSSTVSLPCCAVTDAAGLRLHCKHRG